MTKTLAALALATMALSAPAFAQNTLPPTLQGTGLTPEVAAATVMSVVVIGAIISDDDETTATTTTN
jgi:hypothetical protein